MRHVDLHAAYDEQGLVAPHLTNVLAGHNLCAPLLPGLYVTDQHIRALEQLSLNEHAADGFYFSLLGSKPIQSIADVEKIQVSFLENAALGHFTLNKNEQHALFQIHISTNQLAALFHESEEKITQYFSKLFHSLGQSRSVLTLPMTDKNKAVGKQVLENKTQKLSLTGHIYAYIFTLVEQIKMLNHLNQCDCCQSKVFQAQNLLEVPENNATNQQSLAHQVGLNDEALLLGFYHLVGQSLDDYSIQVRMQHAANILRTQPNAKHALIAHSGLTELQFEAAFIQCFGVSSQQYGQIH